MLPFTLPPAKGHSISPQWDGQKFVYGDQSTPVLGYSDNPARGSDELLEEITGDRHPIDSASRKDALRQIKKFMPAQKPVILEIGCSSGFLIRDLVSSFPEAIIIGADVVKEPLFKLAQNLPGVPLMHFDLLSCPLPDKSVDMLVMLNVLEHIEKDFEALQRAARLLKPGGVLIIEVPASPRLYDAHDHEPPHFRRYSPEDLHRKLILAGFKISRSSHLGFVLFPAFATVKLLKKRFSSKKKNLVLRKKAQSSSRNPLVKWALEFESKRLSNFQLPFGIRALVVAVKKTL